MWSKVIAFMAKLYYIYGMITFMVFITFMGDTPGSAGYLFAYSVHGLVTIRVDCVCENLSKK